MRTEPTPQLQASPLYLDSQLSTAFDALTRCDLCPARMDDPGIKTRPACNASQANKTGGSRCRHLTEWVKMVGPPPKKSRQTVRIARSSMPASAPTAVRMPRFVMKFEPTANGAGNSRQANMWTPGSVDRRSTLEVLGNFRRVHANGGRSSYN